MNAGMMKNRISIEKLTTTVDAIGNQTKAWATHFTCWAYMNGLSGAEYWAAKAQQAENTVVFQVRYCSNLSAINPQEYRIKFDGSIYDITSIDNYQFKNETLNIKAVHHVNS